jgi:hypothetical protein
MTLYQFDPAIQFYQPFALNAVDPARMLIVTGTFTRTGIAPGNFYESTNCGDSLKNLEPIHAVPGLALGYGRPIAYGSRLDGKRVPDVFYVGASNPTTRPPSNLIFHRVTASGPITTLDAYPGGPVVTIAMNPQNYKEVYVSDTHNKVWRSLDEGVEWTDLTANLPDLTRLVTTIELFHPVSGTPMLFAGGFGVFELPNPSSEEIGEWAPVTGSPPENNKIPPAVVLDLHYDYTKNFLVAGTMGRGAFLFGAGTAAAKTASVRAASSRPAPRQKSRGPRRRRA